MRLNDHINTIGLADGGIHSTDFVRDGVRCWCSAILPWPTLLFLSAMTLGPKSSRSGSTSLSATHQVTGWVKQNLNRGWFKVSLAGLWLSFLAAHVATDSLPAQFLDRRLQTLFFEMRGPVVAPEDIVILAMDDQSVDQAEHYRADPDRHQALAPIAGIPWQRRAYAIAIERLLEAGARAVAVDVMFFTDSSYGSADDEALVDVLDRYGDRVVLAAKFDDVNLRQGTLIRPTLPIPALLDTSAYLGNINFRREPDGRIHRHGRAYLDWVEQDVVELLTASSDDGNLPIMFSFAEATLEAAEIAYPPPAGEFINFYGPHQTFTHLPFWYVLDPDPWVNQLQEGAFFTDKIVLIGATAGFLQDFHQAPFSQTLFHPTPMTGVEILANDIASLQSGTTLRQGIPNPWGRALLVLSMGSGFGLLLWYFNRPIARLGWTGATIGTWFWLSYGAFTLGGILLPAGTPIIGFMVLGGSFIVTDIITEQLRKQRLRQTLEQYVTSPIVQEIISQQEDLKDLLRLREAEVIGLLLGNRYRIVRLLGSGGFGETYVAQDTQRPGEPVCVVKQLRIISDDPKAHRLGRRFFLGEAETLENLGHHDQIPRLLAYFEDQHSFYLVEEMVEGRLLKTELTSRRPMEQIYALDLLQGLLPVIAFVHHQGVIHRDIKPSNIIRRKADGKLVLIDFGAVKLISNKLADNDVQLTSTSTVGVGTQGYMPSEQSAGLPKFNSDLYALGITVIEALTGIPAYAIKRDTQGELIWRHAVPELDQAFGTVVERLVKYDFTERYQSAPEVMADLEQMAPRLRSQTTSSPLVDDGQAPESTDHGDELTAATESTEMLPEGWTPWQNEETWPN